MHYSIYSKHYKKKKEDVYFHLFSLLDRYNCKYSVNKAIADGMRESGIKADKIPPTYPDYDLPPNTRTLICLGGDGTILSAILYTLEREIPILGINLGQLGFMAEVVSTELDKAINMLVNENYTLDRRSVVKVESNNALFGDHNFGLNELTIHKRDTSSLIKIKTFLNGELLTTYWTDGLIISTPTGSTGYNLSCGGPIVFPNSSNFIITPIAPHHLNVRPVVVPDNYTLSFILESRADTALCTVDSRNEVIKMNQQLAIQKHEKEVLLVNFPGMNFLYVLHSKLHWGQDERNKVV